MSRKTSKYQYCSDCKRKFTLPRMVIRGLRKNEEILIYCRYCNSNNVYSVDKNY